MQITLIGEHDMMNNILLRCRMTFYLLTDVPVCGYRLNAT